MRFLPLLALPLASCALKLPPSLGYAWPPEVVEYAVVQDSGGEPRRFSLREVWSEARQEGAWRIWTVETMVVDDEGIRPARKERLGQGPGGWALLSVGGGGLPDRHFDPPLLLLREAVEPGDAWFGEHRSSGEVVQHGCEVLAYAGCASGVTSRCVTDFSGHRTVVERDYCPERGQVGLRSEWLEGTKVSRQLPNEGPFRRSGEGPKPDLEAPLRRKEG